MIYLLWQKRTFYFFGLKTGRSGIFEINGNIYRGRTEVGFLSNNIRKYKQNASFGYEKNVYVEANPSKFLFLKINGQ